MNHRFIAIGLSGAVALTAVLLTHSELRDRAVCDSANSNWLTCLTATTLKNLSAGTVTEGLRLADAATSTLNSPAGSPRS